MKLTPLAKIWNLTRLASFAVAAVAAASPLLAGAPAFDDKKAMVPEEPKDIWVHPITGPYWHEDSFVTSDIRLIHAHHHFPGLVFGGGHASVSAAQLRIKLLKNLQLVAYKDGWMEIDTVGYQNNGFNDLAAGLKWAFLQNDALQLHAAVGAAYEFASGDDEVLQDDDEVRFWASVNKGFGRFHFGATANYFLATDNGDDPFGDSNHVSWHIHLDYQVCDWFSPVIELNGYHVLDEGDVVTPFSGADVLNLGGNKSEDVISMGVGAELRPLNWLALRAAYEFPLSDENDIYGHRWTFSAVIKF